MRIIMSKRGKSCAAFRSAFETGELLRCLRQSLSCGVVETTPQSLRLGALHFIQFEKLPAMLSLWLTGFSLRSNTMRANGELLSRPHAHFAHARVRQGEVGHSGHD